MSATLTQRTHTTTEELLGFLARHETVAKPTLLRAGDVVDGWRVTGFLARGGHAEVYRVERGDAIVSIASSKKTASSSDAFETNASTVSVAALKILARDDAASRTRFAQEVQLLKKHFASSLPYVYGAGVHRVAEPEVRGGPRSVAAATEVGPSANVDRPYIVIDLLEPIDLPRADAEIARYLLAVSTSVAALHHQGLVHRDIKPANVMRRANGEIVLIDLGLVKDTARSSRPETNVSIIDGKPVAVGTPAYAAPEQILGGEVSAAVDIHALGKLADVCFESHPPKAWLPIIRRATSSIPAQRYATVENFAKAIRRRNWPRWAWSAIGVVAIAAAVGVWVNGTSGTNGTTGTDGRVVRPARPQPSQNQNNVDESVTWSQLCRETATNLVSQQLVWERLVTNTVNGISCVSPQRAYRTVTNRVMATVINLKGATQTFTKPITLNPSREYFISGPGTLDAELLATAPTRIHHDRVNLMNRTTNRVAKAGITYVFGQQVYLNFPNQCKEENRDFRKAIEDFDGGTNEIRFQGPTSIEELKHQQQKQSDDRFLKEQQRVKNMVVFPTVGCFGTQTTSSYAEVWQDSMWLRRREYAATPQLNLAKFALNGDVQTGPGHHHIIKNFHFPCRFFASRGKYVVEAMIDSIYKKYGIDPNRIPTDAEVELVAYCFDVSESEARLFLAHRRSGFGFQGRVASVRSSQKEVADA